MDEHDLLTHQNGCPADLAGAREWYNQQARRTALELQALYGPPFEEDTREIVVAAGPLARLVRWLRRMMGRAARDTAR